MKSSDRALLQIKDSVARLYSANKELKRVQEYVSEVRKKEQLVISNFMFSNFAQNENTFEVELDEGSVFYKDPVKVRVTKIRQKKVTWDFKKLKKQLPKEVFKKVVRRTYTVNNMDGLVKYLKSCGVDPNKFKKYIDVDFEEDIEAMEQAYAVGEIKDEDVKGCYTLTMGEPYIRLTEIKKNGTKV